MTADIEYSAKGESIATAYRLRRGATQTRRSRTSPGDIVQYFRLPGGQPMRWCDQEGMPAEKVIYLGASGFLIEAVRPDEGALGLEAMLQKRVYSMPRNRHCQTHR